MSHLFYFYSCSHELENARYALYMRFYAFDFDIRDFVLNLNHQNPQIQSHVFFTGKAINPWNTVAVYSQRISTKHQ